MQAAIFKNNQSQAVRLPKQAAFPENVKRVSVTVIGQTRVLAPADSSWDYFFDTAKVSDDFMVERQQEAPQVREEF